MSFVLALVAETEGRLVRFLEENLYMPPNEKHKVAHLATLCCSLLQWFM